MHTKTQLDRTHSPPPLNRFLHFPPLRLLLSGTPMPLAFSLSVSLLLTFLQQKTQHRQIFLFFPSSLQWSVLYLQHTQCSPLCGYTKHEIPCSLQSNFHNIKVLELQSVTIVRQSAIVTQSETRTERNHHWTHLEFQQWFSVTPLLLLQSHHEHQQSE